MLNRSPQKENKSKGNLKNHTIHVTESGVHRDGQVEKALAPCDHDEYATYSSNVMKKAQAKGVR